MRRLGLIVCVAFAAALLTTAVAQATPNSTQYDNPAQSSPGVSNATVKGTKANTTKPPATPAATPATPAATQTTPKSTLPFTGLDLLAYGLAGVALVVSGLTLRRLATSRARR